MKRCIKASEIEVQRGGISTPYFDIQVEPGNDLIRMVDLNGNYTEMYPYEVKELIDALSKAVEIS